ncbi:MAG: hypothetical protein IJY93_01865 [Clostridia bacterium]|nr:hypothetical protein [Clostridia bacterium]
MKKKFGYNEKVLALIATAILAAMFTLPVCAWELWSTVDTARVDKPVHICEVCGSEVSG